MHPHVPTCFTSHLTIHTRNTFRRHHGSRTVSRYRCRRYRIFFWRDISIRRPNGRAIDACDNAGWRHPRSFFPHWYVVYSLCRFCSWFEHSFFSLLQMVMRSLHQHLLRGILLFGTLMLAGVYFILCVEHMRVPLRLSSGYRDNHC